MVRPATPMFPQSTPNAEEICARGALSIKRAVIWSGVSRSDLYVAMERGEIEYLRHGRHRLIPRRVLQRWLAAKLEATRAGRI